MCARKVSGLPCRMARRVYVGGSLLPLADASLPPPRAAGLRLDLKGDTFE